MLAARGLGIARRSRGERPDRATQVYLADTMGELGLFYRLAPIAFIGRSLARGGGQNPLEAATLGVALVVGPDTGNFAEVYERLATAGGVRIVRDAGGLAAALRDLLADPAARTACAAAADQVAADGRGATARTLDELAPILAALDAPADDARA
jgi:3-deoxy-D-manno-octulosonic-acid transferase